MRKVRAVSVLIVSFFIVTAGYALAIGRDDSAKIVAPQATATEHADHATAQPATPAAYDHASHGATKSAAAGHDMAQMNGMGDMDKQNESMMMHMKTMQAQMEKIKATDNPAERKTLMKDHMAAMKSGMKMMREMDGKMMMKSGDCPMMKMMSSPKEQDGMKGMPDDMAMCHNMMQQKADMNHGMMEQIIESNEQLLDMSK
jgi:hypothetical protein